MKYNKQMQPVITNLLLWHLKLARVDLVNDIVWGLAVDRATNTLGCAKNLLGTIRKALCERF